MMYRYKLFADIPTCFIIFPTQSKSWSLHFMFHCCFDIILQLFFLDGHLLTPCSCFSCFPGIRLAAAGRKHIYKHQTKKLKSLSTEALTLSTDAPFFFSCLMKGEHIFLNRTCFRFRLLNVISEMAVAVWKKLRVLYIKGTWGHENHPSRVTTQWTYTFWSRRSCVMTLYWRNR